MHRTRRKIQVEANLVNSFNTGYRHSSRLGCKIGLDLSLLVTWVIQASALLSIQ